jgi:hypothetical protein
MPGRRSDIDALFAAILATAGAFASFAILQIITAALDGTAAGRLAPLETLGRLWVFFVLVPALLALIGVGVPCMLRTSVAYARGALARQDVLGLAGLAIGTALVVAEASMRRSGAASLAAMCAICSWRLLPRARALGDRMLGPLLAIASAAMLGFGIYQRRLLAGEPASVAVAPTLFLVAFYASVAGISAGAAAAGARRWMYRGASLAWLAAYAAWIVVASECGVTGTYAVGGLLAVLAVWVWLASRRHIDAGRSFL